MSKQFDVKREILNLIENPTDRNIAVNLLLLAIDCDEDEFEFEESITPHEYIFGENN